MYLLFQSIFTWAAPVMDAVEAASAGSRIVVPLFGPQLAQDFVADALFSGIGAFLVFVPQIFVLTFVIGLLEDSGYMARAALICHRPLRILRPDRQELHPHAVRRGLRYSGHLRGPFHRLAAQAPADLPGHPPDALLGAPAGLCAADRRVHSSDHRARRVGGAGRDWPCSWCMSSACRAACW
jgi:hypothetical protein